MSNEKLAGLLGSKFIKTDPEEPGVLFIEHDNGVWEEFTPTTNLAQAVEYASRIFEHMGCILRFGPPTKHNDGWMAMCEAWHVESDCLWALEYSDEGSNNVEKTASVVTNALLSASKEYPEEWAKAVESFGVADA